MVWRFQFHIGTHQESIVRPPHGHDEPKLVIIVFQRMYVSAIQGRIPVCFRQYFRLTPVDETLRSTVKNGMPFGQRSLIVVRIVIFYSRQSLLHWYLRKTCPRFPSICHIKPKSVPYTSKSGPVLLGFSNISPGKGLPVTRDIMRTLSIHCVFSLSASLQAILPVKLQARSLNSKICLSHILINSIYKHTFPPSIPLFFPR